MFDSIQPFRRGVRILGPDDLIDEYCVQVEECLNHLEIIKKNVVINTLKIIDL